MRSIFFALVLLLTTQVFADGQYKLALCSEESANYLLRRRFTDCKEPDGSPLDTIRMLRDEEFETYSKIQDSVFDLCSHGCALIEYTRINSDNIGSNYNANTTQFCEDEYKKIFDKYDGFPSYKLTKIGKAHKCTDQNNYSPNEKSREDEKCMWTRREAIQRNCNGSSAGPADFCSLHPGQSTFCLGVISCAGDKGPNETQLGCIAKGKTCDNISISECINDHIGGAHGGGLDAPKVMEKYFPGATK